MDDKNNGVKVPLVLGGQGRDAAELVGTGRVLAVTGLAFLKLILVLSCR